MWRRLAELLETCLVAVPVVLLVYVAGETEGTHAGVAVGAGTIVAVLYGVARGRL